MMLALQDNKVKGWSSLFIMILIYKNVIPPIHLGKPSQSLDFSSETLFNSKTLLSMSFSWLIERFDYALQANIGAPWRSWKSLSIFQNVC